jgi:hypothetical protein
MTETQLNFFDHFFYNLQLLFLNQKLSLNTQKSIEQSKQKLEFPICNKNLSKKSLKAHLELHELKKKD